MVVGSGRYYGEAMHVRTIPLYCRTSNHCAVQFGQYFCEERRGRQRHLLSDSYRKYHISTQGDQKQEEQNSHRILLPQQVSEYHGKGCEAPALCDIRIQQLW